MTFTPPSDDSVLKSHPQLRSLTLIATGGFKAVYRAEIEDRTEAFKLVQIPMAPGRADETVPGVEAAAFTKEMKGRIWREIGALQKCRAPEIVKLGNLAPCELGIEGAEYVAYSEEFLEGKNLWDILRTPSPQPNEKELRALFRSLLRAVKELWSLGYVHRDIKPSNVIKLDNPLRPFVLMDLGIAFSVFDTPLTVDPQHRFLATHRYLAPEFLNPTFRDSIDYRSDLYTIGLTVFEYAAKQHPLAQDRDDMMRTISRALHQMPQALYSLRPDLSADFCALVDQMLKKKPALRPANLDSLMIRLEDGL